MSFDLSHVRHAAHAEPEVLPVQRPGDGAGDGGLAYPGGAVEAEDLALGGASQLADGDELLNAGRERDGWVPQPAASSGFMLRELLLPGYVSSHHPSHNGLPPEPPWLGPRTGSPGCWSPMECW